jgi:hypothetical protein
MNLLIPKVRVEDRYYPKWFNSKTIHTIKYLRTLRRKGLLYPTHNNSSKLLSLESHLTSLMNSAKLDFERTCPHKTLVKLLKASHQPGLCHQFSLWTPPLALVTVTKHAYSTPFSLCIHQELLPDPSTIDSFIYSV